MKKYVKPVFEYVELRTEERLAGSCYIPPQYTTGFCPSVSVK